MADPAPRATLTIRIDPALHRSLAAVAEAAGRSMNAIAEAALTRDVVHRAAELAETYERAAAAMRVHAQPRLADLIDEIAAEEAENPEPVPTRWDPAPQATFQAVSARARSVG